MKNKNSLLLVFISLPLLSIAMDRPSEWSIEVIMKHYHQQEEFIAIENEARNVPHSVPYDTKPSAAIYNKFLFDTYVDQGQSKKAFSILQKDPRLQTSYPLGRKLYQVFNRQVDAIDLYPSEIGSLSIQSITHVALVFAKQGNNISFLKNYKNFLYADNKKI